MKARTITVVSGFAMTAVATFALWQIFVVALLIHGVDEVLGVFGGLL